MRFWFAALAFAGCFLASSAEAELYSRSGYFDSVRVSPESGDQGGIRIQVNDGPLPTVEFALCEGSCGEPDFFPATIQGDRLSFVFTEPRYDRSGQKSGERRANVDGKFVAKGLLLKIDFLDSTHDDAGAYELVPRLKRQP
ncbi:hypothetical protein [Caulobacter sp.]|uniref:hypothetical protein n=1 Tax=Caulobacter sp. TaxID=78 RepID=UPI0031D9C8D7